MKRNIKKPKPLKKRVSTGRSCKKCGKDPYPNYFFCPSCHHKLSEYDEEEDFIYSVEGALNVAKYF
jgi:uncharacterized OB-fold protein